MYRQQMISAHPRVRDGTEDFLPTVAGYGGR